MVLDPVASDPAVAATPELAGEIDPVRFLRSNLKVRSQGGSDYYVIEFTSKSPEKAALIVNKVAEEYRALHDRHEKRLNHLTIVKLQEQETEKELQVKNLRTQLERLAKDIPGVARHSAPSLPKQRPAANPALAGLQAQLIALEFEQAITSARLQAATELFKQAETSGEGFEPTALQVEANVQSLRQV